jgi:molybdopterin-containing oxidoreductase family membrane subunit
VSDPLDTTRPAHPGVWWAIAIGAGLALGFGVWCFSNQTGSGFVITSLSNPGYGGAAWGLYIAFDIFFVGVSFAGITVSALARLFNLEVLKPATRLAELVTIVALIAGGCVIVADLGRPLDGLLKLPNFARPESPFYGTFTLVIAGYMFSSVVFFLLSARPDAAKMARRGWRPLRPLYRVWASGYRGTAAERRRHRISSYWLSITILPLLVTAHSTLGFIFGIQSGRPGWYGALQAPAFVILAGVSGTGMVILFLVTVRWLFGVKERVPDATIRWLGNFMATLALVYLYFMIVEELTASYAAPPADRHVAHVVVGGRYAPMFWITVACLAVTFAVPFVLRLRRKTSVAAVVVISVLANVAAISKRLLIVVPSQTDGALVPIDTSGYVPNYIEIGVITGLFGLLILAIAVIGRLFPLIPTEQTPPDREAPDSPRRFKLRVAATTATVLVALTAIGLGLADSFRLFSGGELDPMIPYSPVIFAGGVILFFGSAIVYEAFPPPPRPDRVTGAGDEQE